MAIALRESSKSLKLIRVAHNELGKGHLKKANKTLAKIEKRGSLLIDEIEYVLTRYQFVQEYYLERGQALTWQMSELRTQEEQLQSDLDIAKKKLDTETEELRRNRRRLEENEKELLKAKDKKDGAKFGKNAGLLGVGLGALLTLVAPPAGIVVMTAAGVTAAGMKIAESTFKEKVEECKQDVRIMEERVEGTLQRVRAISSNIESVSRQITCKKRLRDAFHEEIGKVKEVVAFLQAAHVFWNDFSAATEHGTERTRRLQNLILRAEERKQYTFYDSRGTKRQAQSFLDAWNKFEELVENGNNYLFQMEFDCSVCGVSCSELPHLLQIKYPICQRCYHRQTRRKCTIM